MHINKYLFILSLFIAILTIYLIYSNGSAAIASYILMSFDNNGNETHVLQNLLDKVPDARVRLSKLEGVAKLGPVSMWVAFPAEEKVVPGTAWYDRLWNTHKFDGYELIDDMISLSPCKNHDKIFVQVGAHLGTYPLLATYRGCQGIAVEGMPLAAKFIEISAEINNWKSNQFMVINAAGSDNPNGHVWFNPQTISISADISDTTGQVRIPLITLDSLNTQYGVNQISGKSRIQFVIIDVEGHEQKVLLGAKNLIEERSVIVFQIEVWTRYSKTGVVSEYPGLQLLVKNNYRLFTTTQNSAIGFKSCDELTNRIAELPIIFNETCYKSKLMDYGNCLGEVIAIRADFMPLRYWYSTCPK